MMRRFVDSDEKTVQNELFLSNPSRHRYVLCYFKRYYVNSLRKHPD